MSAPYVGKQVIVVGTSRNDLNGSSGFASDYDRDKGRYNVRLSNGQVVALKPANLQEDPNPSTTSSAGSSRSGPSASGKTSSNDAQPSSSMSTVGIVIAVLCCFYQFVSPSSSGDSGAGLWGGNADMEYDDNDDGYLRGSVRELVTLDQLRGALSHHSDNTGLPVVVDFFSHSCGPCRMIAPAFKKLALEYQSEAVFVKVDVNRNYEAASACSVRAMPTFQFFLNKKKVSELRGADERTLRRYVTDIVQQAEQSGTYVGKEVTRQALETFYNAHDSEKLEDVPRLAEKYAHKTAQLMRVCKDKYGSMPEVSVRQKSSEPASDGDKDKAPSKSASSAKTGAIASWSPDELQDTLKKVRAELRRRGHREAVDAEDEARGKSNAQAEEEDEEDASIFGSAAAINAADGPDRVHRLAIIGGGPAALAAATYAARAGLKPLVIAPAFGGQLLGKGVDVENYPGVVGEYATGRGLVRLMRRQAHSFDARFVDGAVLGVDLSSRPFILRVNGTGAVASGDAAQPEEVKLLARTVILATGAESQWLHVKGENEYRGQGISACATCDGFLHRDQDVVVVGGGDHAMEDALHLARTCRSVTVVHRRDSFRASKILAERVLNHSLVRVRWNTTVTDFQGTASGLTHATLKSLDGKTEKLKVTGAFVAIGHKPQTGFLSGQLALDEVGYVSLAASAGFATATSVRGVFAAGDVADATYRQAVTAAGSGAMAALDVERFLSADGDDA